MTENPPLTRRYVTTLLYKPLGDVLVVSILGTHVTTLADASIALQALFELEIVELPEVSVSGDEIRIRFSQAIATTPATPFYLGVLSQMVTTAPIIIDADKITVEGDTLVVDTSSVALTSQVAWWLGGVAGGIVAADNADVYFLNKQNEVADITTLHTFFTGDKTTGPTTAGAPVVTLASSQLANTLHLTWSAHRLAPTNPHTNSRTNSHYNLHHNSHHIKTKQKNTTITPRRREAGASGGCVFERWEVVLTSEQGRTKLPLSAFVNGLFNRATNSLTLTQVSYPTAYAVQVTEYCADGSNNSPTGVSAEVVPTTPPSNGVRSLHQALVVDALGQPAYDATASSLSFHWVPSTVASACEHKKWLLQLLDAQGNVQVGDGFAPEEQTNATLAGGMPADYTFISARWEPAVSWLVEVVVSTLIEHLHLVK